MPHRSLDAIKLRGNKLGLSRYSKSKFTQKWTNSELNFLISHWRDMSDFTISQKINRTPRAIKAKRGELQLFRQERDRDYTYADLNKYLRGNIYQWKLNSIAACNNQCILSGSKDYAIHHLYNFQTILDMYVDEYDIQVFDSVNDYTKQELEYIVETFNIFHSQFPLGVCVDKELHKLFHHLYGKTFNTPEQWEEFSNNYKKGKYNH